MKVLLILLILFFYGGGRTSASDYWLNIFEERDKEANSGNGISNSADSGVLAWGESYWLQSYMIMYKVYTDIWTARL